jgi:hypothetical protein
VRGKALFYQSHGQRPTSSPSSVLESSVPSSSAINPQRSGIPHSQSSPTELSGVDHAHRYQRSTGRDPVSSIRLVPYPKGEAAKLGLGSTSNVLLIVGDDWRIQLSKGGHGDRRASMDTDTHKNPERGERTFVFNITNAELATVVEVSFVRVPISAILSNFVNARPPPTEILRGVKSLVLYENQIDSITKVSEGHCRLSTSDCRLVLIIPSLTHNCIPFHTHIRTPSPPPHSCRLS